MALVSASPVSSLLVLSTLMRTPVRYASLLSNLGVTILFALFGASILSYVACRKFDSAEKRVAVVRTVANTALTFCIVFGSIAWIWAVDTQERYLEYVHLGLNRRSSYFPAILIVWFFMYFPLLAPVLDSLRMRRSSNMRALPVFSIFWTVFLVALFLAPGA